MRMIPGLLLWCSLASACGSRVDDAEPPRLEAEPHIEALPRYPDPPYGLEKGDVFPNLKLEGYRLGRAPWTTIELADYFDPDGSRGINALVIDVESVWCSVSKQVAGELPSI